MDVSQAVVYSTVEADLAVRELQPCGIAEIGSGKWKHQREVIERLNICAHHNAVGKVDDYVKTFLVDAEKMPTLLHELLVAELWRQKVLPAVMDAVVMNPSGSYLYCNYESVLVNLLECICFNEEVILSMGEDVLELVDYCWRQIVRLFSIPHLESVTGELSAEAIKSQSPLENLKHHLQFAEITRAMSCLSILWFIIDRLADLPMAVMNAVLIKSNLPVGLSEVLLLQPWTRRTPGGAQKFRNGAFVNAPGDDVLSVCTPEAHTWFCLHRLLCDRDCRAKYAYTQHSKDVILRTRRFLNETLLDQIPALQSVQRALEELSFLQPPSGTEEKFRSTLVIEQVPRLMTAINRSDISWMREQERAKEFLLNPASISEDAMRLSKLFDDMFGNGS